MFWTKRIGEAASIGLALMLVASTGCMRFDFERSADTTRRVTGQILENGADGGRIVTNLTYKDNGLGAGTDNVYGTGDDDVLGYNRVVFSNTNRFLSHETITGAGADGKWLTADDIQAARSSYTSLGDKEVWTIEGYTVYLLANILFDEIVIPRASTTSLTMPIFRTPDNSGYAVFSMYRKEGNVVGWSYSEDGYGASFSAQRFTRTKTASGYVVRSIFNKGADGEWDTDDDLLIALWSIKREVDGYTISAYKSAGPDKKWGNDDDKWAYGLKVTLNEFGLVVRDDHVASRGPDNVPFTEDDLYSASVERQTVIESGRSSISTRVRTPKCCSYTQGAALQDLDIVESKLSVFESAFLPNVWFEAKESYSLGNGSGQKHTSGQVRVLENASALNDAFEIGFYDASLNCVPHDEATFEPCAILDEVIKASTRGQTVRAKTKVKVLPENTWALEGEVGRDPNFPSEFSPNLWTFILINRL